LAAWVVAEWIMDRFAAQGLGSSVIAAAAGGLVLLAVVAAPPSVRRDLRR
jgi:hypothetical protein